MPESADRPTPTDTYEDGIRMSVVSLVINASLGVIKLVGGIVGQSYALVADAIESIGDVFGSAVVRAGLVIASQPADTDHPYGHGKAEPLAALTVALMLLGAGAWIAYQSVQQILSPGPGPAVYTLGILIGVVVIKETMYRYESAIAKRIGSTAVHVDAWHHRSDALTSAAAAVGITIALVGGKGYEAADDWAALLACVVIVFNGVRFARDAVHELMDTVPTTSLVDAIPSIAESIAGARFAEKVLVRKVGPRYYVDLHLEVDPHLTVRQGHEIAHDVKDAVIRARPEVADVLVHIEPYEGEGATPPADKPL